MAAARVGVGRLWGMGAVARDGCELGAGRSASRDFARWRAKEYTAGRGWRQFTYRKLGFGEKRSSA